ncbi:MAG: DUF4831 family protein [Dysgonamonadaceae bacterium]|jgi:hypothetical protein|nr:DUF4831 family protein [Dysgonamonadaceae bacterium]
MKKNLTIFCLLGLFLSVSAVLTKAQTNVVKMSATKSTDYGIVYYLPKTVFVINTEQVKTVQKAGQFSKYAKKYLGLDDNAVIQEDATLFSLKSVSVATKGIADKEQSYLVQFKSKTTAPFVCLRGDGVILTVNADYEPERAQPKPEAEKQANAYPIAGKQSVFTEEYFQAGSTAKMAEVAAKQIYKIRESRNDFLTGEADNMPSDGEGLKIVLANLDAQEKALTELFTGTTTSETITKTTELEPLGAIDRETIFRFSRYAGIVDEDDLSGKPVYLTVKQLTPVEEEILDPKHKEKEAKSIVYNLPGEAEVAIQYDGKTIFSGKFQTVQFGTRKTLATSLFEDKKAPVRIYFYPETGAIKQIIQ